MLIRQQMTAARAAIEDVVQGKSLGVAVIGPALGKSTLVIDVLRSLGASATMLVGGTPAGIEMSLQANDAQIVVWENWLMRHDIRLLRMVWDHLESGAHRYIITERYLPDLKTLPPHRRQLFQRILDRLVVVELSRDWMEALLYIEWQAAEQGIISSMVPNVGIDEADAILHEFHGQVPWLNDNVSLFDLLHLATSMHRSRDAYFEFLRPVQTNHGEMRRHINRLPPCPTVHTIGTPFDYEYEWARPDYSRIKFPKRMRDPQPLQKDNYWDKSPWNAFVAMASEKLSEQDVYHAGYARAVIERADQDGVHIGWSGTDDGPDSISFSGKNGGPLLTMDISFQDRTLYLSGVRAKISRVEERARIWLFGNYPIEDGIIAPRDTGTMDLLIDRDIYWEGKAHSREIVRQVLEFQGIIKPNRKT